MKNICRVHTIFFLIALQILSLTSTISQCSQKSINSDESARDACALKLKFLTEHDTRNKLPQIRNIAQELIKLESQQQELDKNQKFTLERELGILTVIYLQGLSNEERLELARSAASCQQAINSLPPDAYEKWRQTEIYRIFLAS